MHPVISTIRIDHPPAVVWPYVGRLEGWTAWVGKHLRPRLRSGPMGVGATYSYTFILGGRIPRRARGIVLAYEVERLIEVRNRVGPILLHERFELAPDGADATRLTYSIGWRLRPRILEVALWPVGLVSRGSTRRMAEYELGLVRDAVKRGVLDTQPGTESSAGAE